MVGFGVFKKQKEVKSMQNSQSVKWCGFQNLGKKVVKSKVATKLIPIMPA